jgi:hypothetical protein
MKRGFLKRCTDSCFALFADFNLLAPIEDRKRIIAPIEKD